LVDYEKVERLAKSMKKWHNRIFPWITRALMLCSLIISSTALMSYYEYEDELRKGWNQQDSQIIPYELFQFLFYLGTFGIPLYMAYTSVFTGFRFPISFKGDGRGTRNVPPPNVN
tara:strand:+ start:1212 stop:1556 length:345 start_codon:yes stop_codon:yes gene_type:complete